MILSTFSPGVSLALYDQLRKKGCVIVTERINTLRWNSKKILDAEHARMGLVPGHGITEESTVEEIKELQRADFIFSPAPAIAASIEQAGIPAEKILPVSYGMDAEDILDVSGRAYEPGPITTIFTGTIGLRKGAHFLLDAWKAARIDGNLIFVGNIDPGFKNYFSRHLDPKTMSTFRLSTT